MPQVADLRAKVSIDGADKAKKDLRELKGSGGSSGGGIMGLASSFKEGIGLVSGFFAGFGAVNIATDALGFLKDQLGDILEQGMSQQKVMAQTAAVIKSTGGAAHISADQVGDLADKLARLTGTSDDEIQSAENILLTFSRINKDAFPRATELTLDLATAMHEDLQSASIQVGKALNDPIQGVTALRRVGVQLSTQQEDAVRHFMAVGDVASAQKVIMDELAKEVGGSAEAYGKTFPGQVARFNVALDQAKEKIGLAVLPVLSDLLQHYIMPLADWLGTKLPVAIQATEDFFNNLQPIVDTFLQTPLGQTMTAWANTISQQVNPAVDSGTGLSGAAKNATDKVKSLGDEAHTTGTKLDPDMKTKTDNATTSVNKLTSAIDPGGGNAGLVPAMRRANQQLDDMNLKQKTNNQSSQGSIPVLSGLGEAFGNLSEKIGEAAGGLGQFKSDVERRFPAAEPVIHQVLNLIGDDFGGALDNIRGVWDNFWGILSFPVRLAFDLLHGLVNVSLDLLGKDVGQAQYDWGQTWQQILQDVKDFGASLVGLFKNIGQAILNVFLAPIRGLWSDTEPILNQWYDRFRAWWNSLPDFPGHTKLPARAETMGGRGGGGGGGGGLKRASGGPASGLTLVGEMGPELLQLPAGSYVYNNRQTRAMMQRNGGMGGNTYTYNIYPQQATIDTQELARIQRRRDLLNGLYS